jgi:hypothetical protein
VATPDDDVTAILKGAITSLIADGVPPEVRDILESEPCVSSAREVLSTAGAPPAGSEGFLERFAAEAVKALPEAERTSLVERARAAVAAKDTPTETRARELATSLVEKVLRQRKLAGAAAPSGLAPGDRFAGRYIIKEALGQGGFGTVYRATHAELGEDVALKVLNSEIARSDDARQRFLREVKATKAFVHGYAVQLRDFGRDEERDALYFTMDLVRGPTLARVLAQERVLAEARAVRLARQVLDVLEAAHASGIVHRDLKPGNLILTRNRLDEEEVRVLDFGLAKALAGGGDSSDLTRPGTACGTPAYMSPEQASGKKVDARTDLYSLGAVLYESLAGRRPHEAGPDDENAGAAILSKVLVEEPADLTSLAPQVSAGVARAVLRALAKRPVDRFASARDFREALASAGAPGKAEQPETRTRPIATRPRPWTALLAGSVAIGAAVWFFALRHDPPRGPEPERRVPEARPTATPAPEARPATITPSAPREPLAIRLTPDAAVVRHAKILTVHLAGRVTDPAAGPIRIGDERSPLRELPTDGEGRFETDVPITPDGSSCVKTRVKLVAGRAPEEVVAFVPVVVDWNFPVVQILTIRPVTPPPVYQVRRQDGRTLMNREYASRDEPIEVDGRKLELRYGAIQVRGRVRDDEPPEKVTVTVDGPGFHRAFEAPLDKDGIFEAANVELPTRDGATTIAVVASDLAGNESSSRLDVTTTHRPAELAVECRRDLAADVSTATVVVRATKPLESAWENDARFDATVDGWRRDVGVPAGGVRSLWIWAEEPAPNFRLGNVEPALARIVIRRAATAGAEKQGRELLAKVVEAIGGKKALDGLRTLRETQETTATRAGPGLSESVAPGDLVFARFHEKDWRASYVVSRDRGKLVVRPDWASSTNRVEGAVPPSRPGELYAGCPVMARVEHGSLYPGQVVSWTDQVVVVQFHASFGQREVEWGELAAIPGTTTISRRLTTTVELPDKLHWKDELEARCEGDVTGSDRRRFELWSSGGGKHTLFDGRYGSQDIGTYPGDPRLDEVMPGDVEGPLVRHGSSRVRFLSERLAWRGTIGLVRALRSAAAGRAAAAVDGEVELGGRRAVRLNVTPEGASATLVLLVDPSSGELLGRRDGLGACDDDSRTFLYTALETSHGLRLPTAQRVDGADLSCKLELDRELDPRVFSPGTP